VEAFAEGTEERRARLHAALKVVAVDVAELTESADLWRAPVRLRLYTPRPRGLPVWTLATLGPSPVHARPVEAPTTRFDSPRLPNPSAPSAPCRRSWSYLFDQAAAARRSRAAPEGQGRDLVPGIRDPSSGCRVTMVLGQAACRGVLEHASAPPSSLTLCALRAQAIDAALKASPVEKDGSDTIFASWRMSSARWLDRRTRWLR
jgi:hypothetical protein